MRRLVPVTALLAALVLGACGGDDGLSTSEYRAQAREVCRDAERATAAVDEPQRATPDAIVAYFRRLLEANERSTERFRRLDPPDELQDAHEDALSANRQGVEEVRRVIAELEEGGDPRQVLTGAQERLQELSGQAADAARRLGVPECADR